MLTKKEDLTDSFETLDHLITPQHLDDPDFKKLHDRFEAVNADILNLEGNQVPTTDEHFVELKTERVYLKDKLYQKLKAWEANDK